MRTKFDIGQIIRCHGEEFLSKHQVVPAVRRAFAHMAQCRTSALGGHVEVCPECCAEDLSAPSTASTACKDLKPHVCSGRQYRNANLRSNLCCQKSILLNMLLESAEMNVQLMEVFQKGSQRCACCHLGKSIHILREALATITKFAIRTGNVGMGVIDIT